MQNTLHLSVYIAGTNVSLCALSSLCEQSDCGWLHIVLVCGWSCLHILLYPHICQTDKALQTHLAFEDIHNWCECFVVHYFRIMCEPSDYRRLHVVSWSVNGFAATLDGTSLRFGCFHCFEVVIHALLAVQWAIQGTSWKWRVIR